MASKRAEDDTLPPSWGPQLPEEAGASTPPIKGRKNGNTSDRCSRDLRIEKGRKTKDEYGNSHTHTEVTPALLGERITNPRRLRCSSVAWRDGGDIHLRLFLLFPFLLRVPPLVWAFGVTKKSDGWYPGFSGCCRLVQAILQNCKKAGTIRNPLRPLLLPGNFRAGQILGGDKKIV